MSATRDSKYRCSTGPPGWAAAMRKGTGSQPPTAFIAATKPAVSGNSRGCSRASSAPSSAPAMSSPRPKASAVLTGDHRLHSMKKPQRPTRNARSGERTGAAICYSGFTRLAAAR